MARLDVEIDDNLHRWAKAEAARLGIPLKEFIAQLLDKDRRSKSKRNNG